MRQTYSLVLLVWGASLAVAAGFHLVSETWTSEAAGSSGRSYTSYTYDNQGNRVKSASWAPDSATGAKTSESIFEYDGSGHQIKGVAKADADTIGRFDNVWAGDLLVATSNYQGGHTLNFIDSFKYADSRLVSKSRWVSGAKTSEHRYDSSASLKTDTLLEPNNPSVFVATKVVASTLDASGRVSSESESVQQGGVWFVNRTTMMYYTGESLSAVVGLEGDGVSHSLIDSTLFLYDGFGNRTLQRRFDNDHMAVEKTEYVWVKDPSTWARPAARPNQALRHAGRSLILPAGTWRVQLADLQGRNLWSRTTSQNLTQVSIPSSVRPGRYVVLAMVGTTAVTSQLLVGN